MLAPPDAPEDPITPPRPTTPTPRPTTPTPSTSTTTTDSQPSPVKESKQESTIIPPAPASQPAPLQPSPPPTIIVSKPTPISPTTNNNNNLTVSPAVLPPKPRSWPGSTKYTITFSSTLKSALNHSFEKLDDRVITMTTPENDVAEIWPTTMLSSTPVLVYRFAQKIDPKKMVKNITFKAAKDGLLSSLTSKFSCGAELVDPSDPRFLEIKQQQSKTLPWDSYDPARLLFFAPSKPLPAASNVTILTDKISSLEGPIISEDKHKHKTLTHGAFCILSRPLMTRMPYETEYHIALSAHLKNPSKMKNE